MARHLIEDQGNMEELMHTEIMDSFTLFNGPCNESVRVCSDTVFWGKVLYNLVECETDYCKAIWNTLAVLEERIDSPHIALKAKNCPEYRRFLQVIARLRNHVTERGCVSSTMRDTYLEHLQNLERFSSNAREDFDVKVHEKAFTDLLNTFQEQEKLVEQFKEKYQKKMAEIENKELQYLLRNSESVRLQLRKDLKSSELKVKEITIDYNHSIRIAKNKLILLKSASKLFEEAWKAREIRRTELVVRTLDAVSKNTITHTTLTDVQNSRDSSVPSLDTSAIVNNLKDEQRISDVEFEGYQKSILKLVESKLMYKYSTADQSKSYDYDSDLVKRYIVTKPHKDKNPHCLLLKKGMKITELIPPTSKGWAFGEARKSENSNPKFGFFHIACVDKL